MIHARSSVIQQAEPLGRHRPRLRRVRHQHLPPQRQVAVAHDDHGPGKVMSLANGKTWVKYDSGALRRYAPPITRKLKLAEVAAPQQRPDEAIVMQLISMGFSENASMRAALAIDNSSPDEAAEWVFAHIEDPDINDPLD